MTMRNLSVSLVPSPFMERLLLAGEIDAIMHRQEQNPGNGGGSEDASLAGLPDSTVAEGLGAVFPPRDRDEPEPKND